MHRFLSLLSPALLLLLPFVLVTPYGVQASTGRIVGELPGSVTGGDFGRSVASAGDFNGDRIGDYVVGATGSAAVAGRVYVFLGGDGVPATPDLVLIGQLGEAFGRSVASAGDINGDGFDDIIVGAPNNAAAGFLAGRAYVYFGGTSPDANADLVISGTAGSQLGSSVAGAGDVGADGYDDVIIGAPYNTSGGPYAGAAYFYNGGSTPNAVADLVMYGTADQFFGSAVSSAGDMNADGYDDFMVGAPAAGGDVGEVAVYHGGPFFDNVADATISGETNYDYFGAELASAGDLDGDGYDDILVSAPYYDEDYSGRAYVFFGSTGSLSGGLTLPAFSAYSRMGISVAGNGDVNGDGAPDIVIGTETEGAYVYFGGPLLDNVRDIKLSQAEPHVAASAAIVDDIDGDGRDDILAGDRFYGGSPQDVGRVLALSAATFKIRSPTGGETFLSGSRRTVRWDGSTLADISYSSNGGATWSAIATKVGGARQNTRSFVVPGPATHLGRLRVSQAGATLADLSWDASDAPFRVVEPRPSTSVVGDLASTAFGVASGDAFGISTAGVGDFNADGYDDFIVGAYTNDATGSNAGAAYVFDGASGASAEQAIVITGAAAGDRFGEAVGAAGDVNGDGFPDIIVGASQNDAGGSNAGRAYVYYGGPGANAVADLILTGHAANDRYGSAVAGAGDVNGDGFGDIIVGAPFNGAGGSLAGRAYVYYGGSPADSTADLVFTGEPTAFLGISLSGAGDTNGDGYDDLLVGSPGATDRAFVYYGGPSGDTVADVVLFGRSANDDFGYSVSGVGDVNGDGFDDIVVGAQLDASAGVGAGRAYVYFGGEPMSPSAGLVLTGRIANDYFGGDVSGAGDVNGDGFADFIVGARGNAAHVYVFFGGLAVDDAPDFVIEGRAPGSAYGFSVSGAGDPNADGFADILIGDPNHDTPASNAGKVELHTFARYKLLTPAGGDIWSVGGLRSVTWSGDGPVDIRLSVDGGATYPYLIGGGSDAKVANVRVPHLPTAYARIQVIARGEAPSHPPNFALSDSLFTIESAIALLAFDAIPPTGGDAGAVVSWRTDPGPEELSGYRLERADASGWKPIVAITKESAYFDPQGEPGSRYRLTGINGLGEEYMIGETSIANANPLSAWPVPYAGGDLSIRFATLGGLGGGTGPADVSLYDASGRRVRSIVRGELAAGRHEAVWDGLDTNGRAVPSGIYFLRLETEGTMRTRRITVLR